MANGDVPEPPGSADANDRRPQLTAIEERVARLERDLAALQRQIAGQGVARAATPQAAPAAWTPPPPPIPLRSEASAVPPGTQRVTSQQWTYAPPAPAPAPESRDSLESRLGSQVFNRIAIVLLLIGTSYALKLAHDNGWIGPIGWVAAGLVAGAALVLWSERFRHKGFAVFSYSLKAVGSGVLYLSLWAAFHLYGLLPATVALLLMILVTAWNAFMAWAQDSELLAVYALAGGFATPMLLSSGGNHEIFLFTYLLAIDVATVALVRLRTWPRLLIGAFPLTVVYFIGWYSQFYSTDQLAATSLFIALFAAAFATVPLGQVVVEAAATAPARQRSTLLEDILLPLANAACAALAGYCVLQDAGYHALLPWLMVALAAVYLALMRLPQTAVASAIHLSLAVVLLTIAIPLKASGAWITVSWLVEGLALVWVATRLGEDEPSGGYASRTLRGLATAALLLGFCGIVFHVIDLMDMSAPGLWNRGTGTALTGVAMFAVAAWLALRAGTGSASGATRAGAWDRIAMGAFLLIAMTAALLTLRELTSSWLTEYPSHPHLAFQSGDFLAALIGLAIFAAVVAVSLRVARQRTGEPFWTNCAALSTIAFNLIAVLTGVREVSAVWAPPPNTWSADSGLQQALAISAFLMLYGALLLAVGFWRRSGFLRWQALLLLVFTIFKTFLYDMRSLSQGYRVVSFLGLGALLLAISFAYQKDWLNLRKSASTPGADPEAAK
ncbi:MAG: DUF2339 domain-containing protein [Acidobacteriaceae bacterium]|jgi:uncharacterized membrane protein